MAQPVHPDEATGFTLHIYMLAGISKTIKTRVCLCINKSSKVIQSGGILGDALEVVTWYVAIVEYRGDIPTYEGHCHTYKKKNDQLHPQVPYTDIHISYLACTYLILYPPFPLGKAWLECWAAGAISAESCTFGNQRNQGAVNLNIPEQLFC